MVGALCFILVSKLFLTNGVVPSSILRFLKWLCSKSLPCNFLRLRKPRRLKKPHRLGSATCLNNRHRTHPTKCISAILSQVTGKQQKCKNISLLMRFVRLTHVHPYQMDINWMDEPSQHVWCCCSSSIEPTMFVCKTWHCKVHSHFVLRVLVVSPLTSC